MRWPDDADFGPIKKASVRKPLPCVYRTEPGLINNRQDEGTPLILPCLPYTLTVSATELNSSSLSKFM